MPTAECTYCGADIYRHTPVFVQEVRGGTNTAAGRFCNYACLSAHIDAEELTVGACCQWAPTQS